MATNTVGMAGTGTAMDMDIAGKQKAPQLRGFLIAERRSPLSKSDASSRLP